MPTSKPFSRFLQAEGSAEFAIRAPGMIASVTEHSKTIKEIGRCGKHFKVFGSCENYMQKGLTSDHPSWKKQERSASKQAERIITCIIQVVLENFFVFFALR